MSAGLEQALTGTRQLQRFRRILSGVMVKNHVERDTLLIFFEYGDRQSETHDCKVYRCAVRRQGHYPSSLTASLVADTSQARAGEPFGGLHRGDRVSGED